MGCAGRAWRAPLWSRLVIPTGTKEFLLFVFLLIYFLGVSIFFVLTKCFLLGGGGFKSIGAVSPCRAVSCRVAVSGAVSCRAVPCQWYYHSYLIHTYIHNVSHTSRSCFIYTYITSHADIMFLTRRDHVNYYMSGKT